MFNFIKWIFKDFHIFTMAYSNNIFKDPLSKEDEEKYISLARQGDKNARDKLIEHNLRLVAHIVKKYEHKVEDMDDLISIGTIGLIKGVDSYEPKHNTRLTTYIARCIENEILMFFRNNNKHQKNISINEAVGFDKEGNEITILDILKTPDPEFENMMHTKNNIILLKKYFQILTKREQDIIIKRYGLGSSEEMTQKDIAKQMNISRSYVSRIEKRALTKMLRKFLKSRQEK